MKKPIETIITCKNCGTTNDISNIKETIKRRIMEKFDADLDWILEEI